MFRLRALGMAGAAAGAILAGAGSAAAEIVGLEAVLSPDNQVPPVDSRAAGEASVSYDTVTHELSWTITHSGLTSPATAAHFHGPAAPGENGPPIITITDLDSPVIGSAIITDDQAAELLAGRWYLNFHTPAFPGGEIRGQVVRVGQ